MVYLAKLQNLNDKYMSMQPSLNDFRNAAINNWERQKESVTKVFNDIRNCEKIVYSKELIEKEKEMLQMQKRRDHLRRYLADQRIIIERQQKLNGELPKSPLFSDLHSSTHEKDEKYSNIKNDAKNKNQTLLMKIEEFNARIEKIANEKKEIEKEFEEQKKINQKLKETKESGNFTPSDEDMEQLMKERKELYSSCIGEEELNKENIRLKQVLEELRTSASDEEKEVEEMTKQPAEEGEDQNEIDKLMKEIEEIKASDNRITEEFLKIKDTIQGLSQMRPVDAFFSAGAK